MDRHPIPRQITTFQFKLIGFLTVKQFAYLLATTGLTITIYFLIPVPIINIVFAGLIGAIGAAFSLLTYNDRSFDIWLKNLALAILNPSQYHYIKKNLPPAFLQGVFIYSPAVVSTHVDANNKLASYIGQSATGSVSNEGDRIHQLFSEPNEPMMKMTTPGLNINADATSPTSAVSNLPQAFISGIVSGNEGKTLPGIMIYIKTDLGNVTRILKTNTHGVFASFHSLSNGNYTIESKDLSGKYLFDTMKVTLTGQKNEPFYINAKKSL